MTTLKHILSGDIFYNKLLKNNVRFIVLVFSLFFVFVMIGAIGDFKIGQKEELKKEISDLKEQSVFLSSELMQLSLINEVDKQIKERKIGLDKHSKPPKIIEIKVSEEE